MKTNCRKGIAATYFHSSFPIEKRFKTFENSLKLNLQNDKEYEVKTYILENSPKTNVWSPKKHSQTCHSRVDKVKAFWKTPSSAIYTNLEKTYSNLSKNTDAIHKRLTSTFHQGSIPPVKQAKQYNVLRNQFTVCSYVCATSRRSQQKSVFFRFKWHTVKQEVEGLREESCYMIIKRVFFV